MTEEELFGGFASIDRHASESEGEMEKQLGTAVRCLQL